MGGVSRDHTGLMEPTGGLGVLGWLKVWVASLSIGDQDAEVRGAHWSRSVCKKSLSRGASTGGFTGFV